MIAGLIQGSGRIEAGDLGNRGHHISAAAAEVQGNAGGSAGSVLGVVEIGVHHALGDVVIDRGGEAAGERVSGTVGHAADIQGPEADADDERMSRTGGFGQRERDGTTRRRLLIERGPLDYADGQRAGFSWIESGNKSEEREENRSDP